MVKKSEWKRETKSYLSALGDSHKRLSDTTIRPMGETLADITNLALAPLIMLGALATPFEDD